MSPIADIAVLIAAFIVAVAVWHVSRTRAERRVRASEGRYRALVENLPDAVVTIYDLDLRAVITGGSLADYGWTPERVVGRTLEEIAPTRWAELEPHFRAALAGERRRFEYQSTFGGRPLELKLVPLRGDEGRIEGVMSLSQDISGRRAAEAAIRASEERLRESERRLQHIFSSLQEGIVVHDSSGAVVTLNDSARRVLDLAEGDPMPSLEMAGWEVVDEDGSPIGLEQYPAVRALQTGQRISDEVIGLKPPGQPMRWLSTNSVPLVLEGDALPYAVVVSFYEITAAREVDRLKDEFFTLISHELRTPLTSIAGYTEMLLDEDEEQLSDTQRRFAEVVDRNAARLQRLITDLLFVAQLEAGRLSFDVADVDLHRVVGNSVESVRAHAGDMAVELDVRVEPAATRGDFDRLGQVLDNLLSNAIKFTPPEGRVLIELGMSESDAVLSVRDTGIGIPAGELADLFTKFTRASTAREREIPGVGIGLSICKAIVEGHGGTIGVESDVGAGTTVSVRLPAVPAGQPLAASSLTA